MPKLSAGIFSPAVAEQEAKKNAASVRAQAAYNKLAKERGSFTRALGEDIIPLGGAIVGGVLGAMAGDPVTGAKMGSAAAAPVGELIAGSGYERAQQAVQEAEADTAEAQGMPNTAQQKMANMAASQQKTGSSKAAGGFTDILGILQKAGAIGGNMNLGG